LFERNLWRLQGKLRSSRASILRKGPFRCAKHSIAGLEGRALGGDRLNDPGNIGAEPRETWACEFQSSGG